MSDMKCPVCNVGYVHESVGHWCCDNEFCPSYDESRSDTYDILITTRKALDVAVDAMKKSNEIVYSAYGSPLKMLKDALEQITALEQKD